MLSRSLFLASLGLACLFLSSAAHAADTYRLALPGGTHASTQDLLARPADLQDDTLSVFYRARRGFYGGFGGYGYYTPRYYSGFSPRYYSSFPRYYGGYSRGYYPRYYSYYPRYYGYTSYPSYSYYSYSYPVYNYGYSYYYAPCSLPATNLAPMMPRIIESGNTVPSPGNSAKPLSPSMDEAPTYPYDGGPKNPVPMPSNDGTETLTLRLPRVPTVVGTIPVSTNPVKSTGKWSYPAYGESPRRSGK